MRRYATRKLYLQHDINAPAYSPGASSTTAGINARHPYQPPPKTYTFADIELNDNVAPEYVELLLLPRQSRGNSHCIRTEDLWDLEGILTAIRHLP